MGAFEDRLAAGYRAANTPAKMPQPTTPTEALGEALREWFDWVHVSDDEVRYDADHVLAALPPGWRLVGPDDVTATVDGLAKWLKVAYGNVWPDRDWEDDARYILDAIKEGWRSD